MIHQLRVYEIFEHNKAAFHERFKGHASRIMRSYGFDLVAAWESQNNGRTEFLYLLAWPDEATMQRAWNMFRADPAWQEIKRLTTAAHGELVGEITERTLTLTEYSPEGRIR